jgi:hypothetical protein
MNRSPALSTSLLQHAARRQLRLSALLLLVLAVVAACGVTPTGQTNQGPASLPTIVSQSAIVCESPARPAPAGGCVVQDAATGISLRVTNAYADVTSTVVQLETANTAGYPLAIIWGPQLALPSGRTFQVAGGSSGAATSLTVYDPVPPADFAPLVHFVTTAHFMLPQYFGMNPPTAPPAPPWLKELDRITLSVPFALAPARSGSSTYQQAPIVKQGIGVQVQWLQVSPARTAFYGPAGGASIELLFSGLPADLELLSFLRLESQNSIGGTRGDYGPGRVELQIPGMSVSTPAFTVLQNPPWPHDSQVQSVDPTVGATGTVQVEVSYQGGGIPTGQPATVSISQIQLLTGGIDGNTGAPPTLPTYQITLPLTSVP